MNFLFKAILFIVGTSFLGASIVTAKKPNIIMIYADDMGYGDAGCYGDTNLVPTPNIDRLAKEGVRFTDGYVTSPKCGPSRYGLLTGMYQQRIGVQNNPDTWNSFPGAENETLENNRIPKGHLMMNQALNLGGYVTGMSGKSNMPCYPKTTFDEYKYIMTFGGNYFPEEDGTYGGVDAPGKHSGGFKRIIWGPEREGDKYLTDLLGDHAVNFIKQHKEKPFMYYLGFNAPHSPMQAKKSHQAQVAHIKSEANRLYAAMLISMDENIGKVLDVLDELGIAENTIVAFSSDNGATFAYRVLWPEEWPREILGSNGSLRGFKGQYFEGGIRVPYIMRWPAKLTAGQVYKRPVSTLDFYSTFCSAANVTVPKTTRLDGVDLAPYLTGEKKGDPHEALFWHEDDTGVVREGDWKLMRWKKSYELFNLGKDPSESKNVAKQYPEIVQRLKKRLTSFTSILPEPLNQRERKVRAKAKKK